MEDSRTCIIHTESVVAGSGTEGFGCWVFARCGDEGELFGPSLVLMPSLD